MYFFNEGLNFVNFIHWKVNDYNNIKMNLSYIGTYSNEFRAEHEIIMKNFDFNFNFTYQYLFFMI